MTVVFLIEERSMQEALKGLLPKILPGETCILVPHAGKQDLEKSIQRKLRAWRDPKVRFVVVHDQDSADCYLLKNRLQGLCRKAGRENCLVRIACRELESWFLGDLEAVESGMALNGIARLQEKRRFRDPDRLGNPEEELRKLVPSYQQISGARAIGPLLNPEKNKSRSFQVFVAGLRNMMSNHR
ncbi:MAG: DUF4276 family protein [Thermodesulfobacteriota bacterium]